MPPFIFILLLTSLRFASKPLGTLPNFIFESFPYAYVLYSRVSLTSSQILHEDHKAHALILALLQTNPDRPKPLYFIGSLVKLCFLKQIPIRINASVNVPTSNLVSKHFSIPIKSAVEMGFTVKAIITRFTGKNEGVRVVFVNPTLKYSVTPTYRDIAGKVTRVSRWPRGTLQLQHSPLNERGISPFSTYPPLAGTECY